jgi:hypothetical protein
MIDDQEDPLVALKRLKTQAAPVDVDPLEQLKAMRHDPNKIHEDFKSGALQRRNARLNQNDADMVEAETPDLASLATGAVTNAAQGIPGMEMAQAGARSLVRKQPYREALNDIRGTTGQIPKVLRVGQRVLGAVPLAAVLPGSALASGAIIGGAEGALGADPDQSLATRAAGGVIGAGVGAVAGKGTELLSTGARVLSATPAAQRLQQMLTDRAKSATPLFNKALSEGVGKTGTPAIKSFLNEPDVAEIVTELQSTRKFANTAADAPEMLDAVYKVLSDRGAQLKKGLESVSPTKPNIGRFRAEDVREAKDQALHAMSGGKSLPGPMPTYRDAVENFAEHSNNIGALRRGADIVRTKLTQMPTGKNLDRTTPEAFAKWAQGASGAERKAAGEGILGEIKMGVDPTKPLKSARAVSDAPSLLRAGQVPRQSLVDMLIQQGIIAGDNALKPN